jgi:hypothetical protein
MFFNNEGWVNLKSYVFYCKKGMYEHLGFHFFHSDYEVFTNDFGLIFEEDFFDKPIPLNFIKLFKTL